MGIRYRFRDDMTKKKTGCRPRVALSSGERPGVLTTDQVQSSTCTAFTSGFIIQTGTEDETSPSSADGPASPPLAEPAESYPWSVALTACHGEMKLVGLHRAPDISISPRIMVQIAQTLEPTVMSLLTYCRC
jgi:hypothetical protein